MLFGADETPAQKKLVDGLAWSLNIFTSVAIVMVNKQLMNGSGYGFSFATTLCGLHFLCTSSIGLFTSSNKGGSDVNASGEKMRVPPNDIAMFVVVAATSIIGLNMSLMLNTIGFYQVCKLAQIPTMCVLEGTLMGKRFSRRVIQAIVIVLMGVGIATVSDVEMNFQGTVAAVVGVVATSGQQILVAHLQKKHSVTSNFLLAKTSPYMAASMLLFGPAMDELVTGKWVFDYEWSSLSLTFLAVSCFFAGARERLVVSVHRSVQRGVVPGDRSREDMPGVLLRVGHLRGAHHGQERHGVLTRGGRDDLLLAREDGGGGAGHHDVGERQQRRRFHKALGLFLFITKVTTYTTLRT
jgi:solute carrier family 35 protein E3